MKIYTVALVSRDPSHAVDQFYKYRGAHLPDVGDVIEVVRFVRGRPINARVTRVRPESTPAIEATEIN